MRHAEPPTHRDTPSSPATTPTVVCRNVRKSYGTGEARVEALRGVDLEVRAGEILLLMGPSGCGKTTLISIVAGILRRDNGECLILGRDLEALGERERARFRGDNVGFVFQSFHLIPTLSAQENVALPLLLADHPRRKAIGLARETLERVGLGGRAASPPNQLSGGEKQRVAIARALVHRPRLVVCDEPTSSLDHQNGHKVMELLRALAHEANAALIVVSHDPRIVGFADRIARMDDGRIEAVEGAAGLSLSAH